MPEFVSRRLSSARIEAFPCSLSVGRFERIFQQNIGQGTRSSSRVVRRADRPILGRTDRGIVSEHDRMTKNEAPAAHRAGSRHRPAVLRGEKPSAGFGPSSVTRCAIPVCRSAGLPSGVTSWRCTAGCSGPFRIPARPEHPGRASRASRGDDVAGRGRSGRLGLRRVHAVHVAALSGPIRGRRRQHEIVALRVVSSQSESVAWNLWRLPGAVQLGAGVGRFDVAVNPGFTDDILAGDGGKLFSR